MPLYCGIDLHSTNSYVAVADEKDQVVLAKRLPNRLEVILRELEPVREGIAGLRKRCCGKGARGIQGRPQSSRNPLAPFPRATLSGGMPPYPDGYVAAGREVLSKRYLERQVL